MAYGTASRFTRHTVNSATSSCQTALRRGRSQSTKEGRSAQRCQQPQGTTQVGSPADRSAEAKEAVVIELHIGVGTMNTKRAVVIRNDRHHFTYQSGRCPFSFLPRRTRWSHLPHRNNPKRTTFNSRLDILGGPRNVGDRGAHAHIGGAPLTSGEFSDIGQAIEKERKICVHDALPQYVRGAPLIGMDELSIKECIKDQM
nr:uncharacterized protein LOC115253547 [Aedes albopictus]